MPRTFSSVRPTWIRLGFALAAGTLALAGAARAQDDFHTRAVTLYDAIHAGAPGDATPARAVLERADAAAPLAFETLAELGSILYWTSQTPAAVLVQEAAVGLRPASAQAWKTLGDYRAMAARPGAALEAYRRAADLAPADSTLEDDARERLARSAMRHARLLERAERYRELTGAYVTDAGEVWILRYDPYLTLFPTLLDTTTGEYRVLRPTEDPDSLDYSTGEGKGHLALRRGDPARIDWTRPDGTRRAAERLPVETREVEIDRGDVVLSGTLLIPAGEAPGPGIALLHGGGVQTRSHLMNEAWLFAAHGLAVAVWDKRGTGRSAGTDWTRVGFDALVEDAAAMVETLRARPEVDAARVGLWGHSQGGWLAPMLARRDPSIAFAILAAGPATGVHRQSIDAVAARMAERPAAEVAAATDYMERLFGAIREGASVEELQPIVSEAREAEWGDVVLKPELAFEPVWWKRNDYEPETTLREIGVPVLALFGSADTAVPVEANAPSMARRLAEGKSDDFTIAVVPGADHTFMTGEDRISPIYPGTMSDWVAARNPEAVLDAVRAGRREPEDGQELGIVDDPS